LSAGFAIFATMSAFNVGGVSGNLVTADIDYEGENTALINAWEDAISIALEGIYRYETNNR